MHAERFSFIAINTYFPLHDHSDLRGPGVILWKTIWTQIRSQTIWTFDLAIYFTLRDCKRDGFRRKLQTFEPEWQVGRGQVFSGSFQSPCTPLPRNPRTFFSFETATFSVLSGFQQVFCNCGRLSRDESFGSNLITLQNDTVLRSTS